MPEARCRLTRSTERKWKEGKLCDWRGAFSFFEMKMGNILQAAKTYAKLTDVEYSIILGKKNKNISLTITFEAENFFHLAGLHYLKDRSTLLFGNRAELFQKILNTSITANQLESSSFYPEICDRINYLAYLEEIMDSNETIFKYNPKIEAFSMIKADFLMKNKICTRNIFTFLSQEKLTGKYFCRSFFPQTTKDYSIGQSNWTLLYKKKILKSTGEETVLYNKLNY